MEKTAWEGGGVNGKLKSVVYGCLLVGWVIDFLLVMSGFFLVKPHIKQVQVSLI